jgi:hypothetical protein
MQTVTRFPVILRVILVVASGQFLHAWLLPSLPLCCSNAQASISLRIVVSVDDGDTVMAFSLHFSLRVPSSPFLTLHGHQLAALKTNSVGGM